MIKCEDFLLRDAGSRFEATAEQFEGLGCKLDKLDSTLGSQHTGITDQVGAQHAGLMHQLQALGLLFCEANGLSEFVSAKAVKGGKGKG